MIQMEGQIRSKSLRFKAGHLNILKFFQSQMVFLFTYLFIPFPLLLSVSRYGWKEEADGKLRGRKGNRIVLTYIHFRKLKKIVGP